MDAKTAAEEALRQGDCASALHKLQEAVRAQAANAPLRVFLFQLLAVLGQWERALNQLNVAAELDASTLAMAQMYRAALQCEVLRAEVFAGRRAPLVFGQPETWLALLIEALLMSARGGQAHAAESLRQRAFDEAPASAGSLNEVPFSWLADADMRLGPVCEAIIDGKYYWIPYTQLASLHLEAPADLRDMVWMPAQFEFTNGGQTVGVIPTRYPGSELSSDPAIQLARKTDWSEVASGVYHGLGQRLLSTEEGDVALLDVREIRFRTEAAADEASGG